MHVNEMRVEVELRRCNSFSQLLWWQTYVTKEKEKEQEEKKKTTKRERRTKNEK